MPDSHDSALMVLRTLLHGLGSANDAEDRGFEQVAGRMRAETCDAIRILLDDNPGLETLLPGLRPSLEDGSLQWVGWSQTLDELDALDDGPAEG